MKSLKVLDLENLRNDNMSKVLIISDLHIGDKKNQDDFFSSNGFYDFTSFIAKYIMVNRKEISKIILNGDFFELWQSELANAFQEYNRLFQMFSIISLEGIEIIYIPGNHDSVPFAKMSYDSAKYNIPMNFYGINLVDTYDKCEETGLLFPYYSDGFIWVEHGHRFDEYNRDTSISSTGEKVAGLIGDLENIGLKDIDKELEDKYLKNYYIAREEAKNNNTSLVLELLKAFTSPRKNTDAYKKFREESFKFAENKLSKDKKIIVIGHTHHPELEIQDNITYVNDGCWVSSPQSFCLYDEEDHSVELYKWENEKAILISKN